jgi:homoserine dehydrogenase
MNKKHKIMIVGFGTVGQGFYELFLEKKSQIGLLRDTAVSEIVDTKLGYIKDPAPSISQELKDGKVFEKRDVVETIRQSDADIVCEFTLVNIKDGEPAFSHIKESFREAKHVITTNKGPIALHYEELSELALKSGTKLRFKGTVMSGTPSFNVLDLLPGIKIEKVRGIFNGTTNFILTEMSKGKSFEESLSLAQDKGYAEADPTMDIDGFDAALKAVIFSKVIGWSENNFKAMEIQGIRNVSVSNNKSERLKLLVSIDPQKASVKPVYLPSDDLLSNVNGVLNACEITTDTLGKIFVVGPGAGRRETAQAAISDLVEILHSGCD